MPLPSLYRGVTGQPIVAPSPSTGANEWPDAIEYLHDLLEGGATAYTPVWTATAGTPAIGAGSIAGSYLQLGDRTWVSVTMAFSNTSTYGTAGSTFRVSQPVTATKRGLLNGTLRDASANVTLPIYAETDSSGLFILRQAPATPTGPYVAFGQGTLITLASTDTLHFSGWYPT